MTSTVSPRRTQATRSPWGPFLKQGAPSGNESTGPRSHSSWEALSDVSMPLWLGQSSRLVTLGVNPLDNAQSGGATKHDGPRQTPEAIKCKRLTGGGLGGSGVAALGRAPRPAPPNP